MTTLPATIRVSLFYDGIWNDITSYVRGMPSEGYGIDNARGRSNEATNVNPGSCVLTLDNRTGRFSPRNPRSPLFGKIGRNTPIRVEVTDPVTNDPIRFIGEVIEWPQEWGQYEEDVYTTIEAAGILRRLLSGAKPLESPLRSYYLEFEDQLASYLPLESGNTETGETGNLVEGALGMDYVTSEGRAPQFREGDTPPGSDSLPLWPVLEYFDWSVGSSVIDGEPPYTVYISFRIPEDFSALTLQEWRTGSGTFSLFQIGVNASGQVYVFASDEDELSPVTYTATLTAKIVNDGVWRTAAVAVEQDGTSQTINISVDGETGSATRTSTDVGPVIRQRPRPLFDAAPAADQEPIGLGHAVIATGNMPLDDQGPVNGFAGEVAAGRFLRLCHKNDVAGIVPTDETLVDEFDRVVVGEWGTATSGQEWITNAGSVDVNVNNGNTTTTGTASFGAVSFEVELPESIDGVDFYYTFETTSVAEGDIIFVFSPGLNQLGSAVQIFFNDQLVIFNEFSIAAFQVDVSMSPDTIYVLRIQAIGFLVRVKLWEQAAGEPDEWTAFAETQVPLPRSLSIIQGIELDETITTYSLYLNGYMHSSRMGAQQIDTLVNNLRQAELVDHGILYETRNELGLTFLPLSTLYNPVATLAIDYEACQLRHPLRPVDDDRFLENDVTAQGSGGGEARVRKQEGVLSTQSPPNGVGVYDSSYRVNTYSRMQLEDWAGWQLYKGTQDEARFPIVRIRNQAPQSCPEDPHFPVPAAAIDTGKLLTIANPPDWLPPELIQILVQGYSEHLDEYEWLTQFNGSPGALYQIGTIAEEDAEIGPAEAQRYESVGSTTVADFEAGVDTSIQVQMDLGDEDLWTTEAAHFQPNGIDIMVAGVRLRVTSISGSSSPQTFTVQQNPINGITKTIPAGSQVRLFNQAVYAV